MSRRRSCMVLLYHNCLKTPIWHNSQPLLFQQDKEYDSFHRRWDGSCIHIEEPQLTWLSLPKFMHYWLPIHEKYLLWSHQTLPNTLPQTFQILQERVSCFQVCRSRMVDLWFLHFLGMDLEATVTLYSLYGCYPPQNATLTILWYNVQYMRNLRSRQITFYAF